jgi:hypothetical protein
MKNLFAKTNLVTWILVGTIAGFLALPLSGNGGLLERFSHLAPVEYETGQTLAHEHEIEEPEVDWILASKDTSEEDEVDWTLASKDTTEEDEVDWTLA